MNFKTGVKNGVFMLFKGNCGYIHYYLKVKKLKPVSNNFGRQRKQMPVI